MYRKYFAQNPGFSKKSGFSFGELYRREFGSLAFEDEAFVFHIGVDAMPRFMPLR
jgi:hypothetical protein